MLDVLGELFPVMCLQNATTYTREIRIDLLNCLYPGY